MDAYLHQMQSNVFCSGKAACSAELLTCPVAQQTSTHASCPAGHTAAWRRWHWKQTSSSWASPLADTGTCESAAFASQQIPYLHKQVITQSHKRIQKLCNGFIAMSTFLEGVTGQKSFSNKRDIFDFRCIFSS